MLLFAANTNLGYCILTKCK